MVSQQSNATVGAAFIARKTVNTVEVQALPCGSRKRSPCWAKRIICGVALTGLSLSLLASGKAEAISITFEKIADTNTPIPSGTGNFGTYFDIPSIDNGNVAFEGGSEYGEQDDIYNGIYIYTNGQLSTIANKNTPIPGGAGTFDSVYSPSLDNGNVAFRGYGDASFDQEGNVEQVEQRGIYTNFGGKLKVIANKNTPIPGSTGTFDFFFEPSLDNGSVAFTGDNDATLFSGIYTNLGSKLKVIANKNTPIPGGAGTFDSVYSPSLDNGNVAFRSFSFDQEGIVDQGGIYTYFGNELDVLADMNTPIPGGQGNFQEFDDPSLDNGNVAFRGYRGASFDQEGNVEQVEQRGIYTNFGGKLKVVADLNTSIPGGTGTFDTFLDLSLDNGNVAFWGYSGMSNPRDGIFPTREGIYTNIGGELAEVIAIGNLLDSKKVDVLRFGREGLSGNQVAFTASFTDGSQGIYVATVPEPASVPGTLAFGTFGAGWMLKRKQRKQKLTSCGKPIE